MNLLEAVPDQNLSLRFKLGDIITGPGGSESTATLLIAPTQTTLRSDRNSITFTPTLNGYSGTPSFSFTLNGQKVGQFLRQTSFDPATGALGIQAYNFPATTKEFSITINETSGTGKSVNAVIRVLPSGDAGPDR